MPKVGQHQNAFHPPPRYLAKHPTFTPLASRSSSPPHRPLRIRRRRLYNTRSGHPQNHSSSSGVVSGTNLYASRKRVVGRKGIRYCARWTGRLRCSCTLESDHHSPSREHVEQGEECSAQSQGDPNCDGGDGDCRRDGKQGCGGCPHRCRCIRWQGCGRGLDVYQCSSGRARPQCAATEQGLEADRAAHGV